MSTLSKQADRISRARLPLARIATVAALATVLVNTPVLAGVAAADPAGEPAAAPVETAEGLPAGGTETAPPAPTEPAGPPAQSDVPATDQGQTPTETPAGGGASPEVPAPSLVARRGDMPVLQPGQQAEVQVFFENLSDLELVSPVAAFSASPGLGLAGNASSVPLESIPAHGTTVATIQVEALAGSQDTARTLYVQTSFSYTAGTGLVQTTASDAIPIPVTTETPAPSAPTDEPPAPSPGPSYDGGSEIPWTGPVDPVVPAVQNIGPTGTVDGPVPNIIVKEVSYGGGAVATGSVFPLAFTFANTSSSTVCDNIVVSLDMGEQFAVDGGTNSFYVANLGAGATQQQTMNVRVLVSEKASVGTVTVGFKYEYVSNGERKQASSESKLTIPVYHHDRFEVGQPSVPADAMVGMESIVTVPYVNKGRGTVSNLSARIEGDGAELASPTQNIGNLEPGKSGTIGFPFTPQTEGKLSLTVTIEYENANEEVVRKTVPVSVMVEGVPDEPLYDDGTYEDEPELDGGLPVPVIAGMLLAVVAAVGGIIAIVRRIVKRRREAREDPWDLPGDSPAHFVPMGTPFAPTGSDHKEE